MEFVKEKQTLQMKNCLKFRKLILNSDVDDIIFKMKEYIEKNGGRVLRILTKTIAINFEKGHQRLDTEFILEANQPIKGNNIYKVIHEYKIINAVNSNYKGNPKNASMATREVNNYIRKKELIPRGPTHQVINNIKKEKKNKKKNQVDLDIYIEVA